MPDRRSEDVRPQRFPNRRRGVRSYLVANAFEWALAVEALVTAVLFFIHPSSPENAVALAGPAVAWVWNMLYLLAGAGTIAGMLRLSLRVEAAGLILLISALSINAVAIGVYLPSWSPFVVYVVLTAACILRVRLLFKLAGAAAT